MYFLYIPLSKTESINLTEKKQIWYGGIIENAPMRLCRFINRNIICLLQWLHWNIN